MPSEGPNSNEAKVKESAAKPLGTQQFRLIGMGVFSPAAQKGHKVEAIGMLIKDAGKPRESDVAGVGQQHCLRPVIE